MVFHIARPELASALSRSTHEFMEDFLIVFAHHGSQHIAVLVKTGSMDELLGLVEAQPDVYFKPAYYGASGCIGVILNRPPSSGGVDWDHVGDWLQRSWRSVAPARLTKLLDAADQF